MKQYVARVFYGSMKTIMTALLTSASMAPSPSQAGTTIIHAGTLLLKAGDAPLEEQTIVVRDDRIVEIRAGYVAAVDIDPDATMIELRDKFVMPAMMDMHVHLGANLAAPKTERDMAATTPPAARALKAAEGAWHKLLGGFTTVRDVGDDADVIFPLRDAIAKGTVPGPRIFATGPAISRTGGHGDVFCDGVESCRQQVRHSIALGADYIKIATSGSGSDETGTPESEAEYFPEEIATITATAHQLKRRVAAHAVSTNGIDRAIESGVDTIEHGIYANENSFRLMKSRHVTLVPTTFVVVFLDRPEIQAALPPKDWAYLTSTFKAARALPGRAYRAGVTLALGTDSGNEASANAARELELYVESGVPAAETLKAATINAAAALGRQDELGQLKAGFIADIIAVDSSPLQDITTVQRVSFVMKDGTIYKSGGVPVLREPRP